MLIALAVAAAAAQALPELVLDARAPVIAATIAGQPVMLRVDPAAETGVDLNGSAAARLGLTDPERRVGRVRATGGVLTVEVGRARLVRRWTADSLTVAGAAARGVRVAWDEGDHVAGADGSVSPALLPHDRVRLVWRGATAADRTATLPARLHLVNGLASDLTVGNGPIEVEFAPLRPTSVATAAAGAIIAGALGGRVSGAPVAVTIVHGIARPTRTLRLDRPLTVGPLAIDSVQLRLFDWAGDHAPPPDADPDAEATVTSRLGSQRGWASLTIAADRLAACASLEWQRTGANAGTITLTCPGE